MDPIANPEDEFDSQLRETFILTLFLGGCLAASSLFLIRRRVSRDDLVDEPFLCSALSALSLAFALSSMFTVPVDQALRALPQTVAWFGINGARFSNSLASISMAGSTVSLFLLNPFAFLFSESSDGTWRSFWTTLVELALLLLMLFCIAMLFFTRSTFSEALLEPTRVVMKLTSLIMHVPGSLAFLYFAPEALVQMISGSLGMFVPWRRSFAATESRRLKDELRSMQEWSKARGKVQCDSEEEEFRKEIEQFEKASSLHPILRNLQAAITFCMALSLAIGIIARVILPNNLTKAIFGAQVRAVDALVSTVFLYLNAMAATKLTSIAAFLSSTSMIRPDDHKRRGNHARKSSSSNLVNQDMKRSDSNLSLMAADSLSLARFVSYALVYTSSSHVVLTGMFGLDTLFTIKCHPQLRNQWIVATYSAAFVVLFGRSLLLKIPILGDWLRRKLRRSRAKQKQVKLA